MVDLTSEINELRQSPIFALSKGNNELSHSNFWAWLIDIEFDENGKIVHPFVEIFIKDFYQKGYEFVNVTREEANRDLSIHYLSGKDEKIHVVENKLKSIPTDEQLERYEDALGVSFAGGTLTGIKETIVRKDWSFMSYSAIADEIESITKKYKSRLVEKLTIINTYVADIRAISKIISEIIKENDGEYTWNIDEKLEPIKLADITLKHIGADYCKKINEKIYSNAKDLNSKEVGMPEAELAYNNKKPTLTVVYKEMIMTNKDKKKEVWRLGVQIEGKQFRIYGGPAKEVKPQKLYKLFIDKNWLEEYNGKTINEKESGMREKPGYCKYSTSVYTHLYQHWKIKKEENWTIDKLGDLIIDKLKFAKDLIDNKNIGKEMTELN